MSPNHPPPWTTLTAKLILVRHGETPLNRDGRVQGLSDAPLSDLGKAQARAVADALAPDAPFHLYASPLSRAAQTARPIADAHGLLPTTIDDLREADVGELDGLTIAQARERYPAFMRRWAEDAGDATMPGGESLRDVRCRTWRAVRDLVARHPDTTTVAVTHNFVIQTVLSAALSVPLDNARRMRQQPGCITRLEFAGSRVSLVSSNETWHLRGLSPSAPAPQPGRQRENQ